MIKDFERIEKDFDHIAALHEGWTQNAFFYGRLIKDVPIHCESALEIGCGSGEFTRMLALRSKRVLAVDLSSGMIKTAEDASTGLKNIEYRIGNILEYEWPGNHFDCIVSIATLHHLPLESMFEKIAFALKSGGRVIVLDMLGAEGAIDYVLGAVSIPLRIMMQIIKNHRINQPVHIRKAWEEHGKAEVYTGMSDLRKACRGFFPQALIRRYLFWRYSLVWTKPN